MADTFFYPGNHPVRRRPAGGSRPFVPEYTPTVGQNFYDTLDETALGVPRWMWMQEMKDIQSSWEASYKSPEVSVTTKELNAEGAEEIAELPGGIGIKVSVNPMDWINDPTKQIENLTIGAARNVFNMSDLTSRSRKEFWSKLTERNYSPFYLGDGNQDELSEDPVSRNLIRHPKPGNFYKGLDSSMGEFAVSVDSTGSRNKAMRGVSTSVIGSLKKEIDDKLFDTSIPNTRTPKLANNLDASVFATAEKFAKKADLVDKVNLVISGDKKKGITGLGDIKSEIDQAFLGGSINSAATAKKLTDFAQRIEHAQEALEQVKGISKKEAHAVARLENHLNQLSDAIKPYAYRDSSGNMVVKVPSGIAASQSLRAKLTIANSKLVSGNFGDGSYGSYVNHVLRQEITDTKSDLNKKVINATQSGSTNYILSNPSRRLARLSSHINSTYEWEAARDLVEDLQEGKLPVKFIYKQMIQPRIEVFTPSYWIGRTLDRSHYFGLTINDDVATGAVNGGVLGSVGNFMIKKSPMKGLYDVNINLGVIDPHNAWKKVIYIKGDYGLKKIIDAKAMFGLDDKSIKSATSHLVDGLSGNLKTSAGGVVSKSDFLKILNGDRVLAASLRLDAENCKAIANFRRNFLSKYFRTLDLDKLGLTLDKHGRLIGSAAALDAASDRLHAFFLSIHSNENNPADFFSIGAGKAGILDKYAKWLSRVQSNTVVKYLSVIINPVVKGKEIILEQVNAKIASIIAAVFGDATGGLGYAIAWAIKIAVQWVLSKLEKIFKKFWQAVGHFDVKAIGGMMDDAVDEIGKWVVYILLFSFLPFIMVSGFMSKMVSTLPVYDPSQIGEIKSGGGSLGLGYGDGSEANCDITTKSLSSYDFMQNVSGGGNTGQATALMEEMLMGFWCYWNQSPSFPELFNLQLFAINPFPGDLSSCWDCLFWCTFLPWKAGLDNSGQSTACKMESHYKSGSGHYVPIEQAYVNGHDSNVRPGDIIFIASSGRRKHPNCPADVDSNHVGVVYAVTPDAVITLHSNSGEKAWAYGVDDDGHIMDNEYHAIQGFGGPGN
ncbi:hypothetical protein HYV31_02850 [candidate division WWE3 bacterium]|nr:hypothetical protein [candidate division WWE3 bacterium]